MSSNPFHATGNSVSGEEKQSFSIDPKRIFYHAVRYWYLIVLSVLTGLAIAFIVNRYSTKVYSVNASIIIKESEEVSGGELLYNNPLVKFYRNYLNEIYILKSLPLMERTVSELKFESSIYRIGRFVTTESYKSLPFDITLLRNERNQKLFFTFKVLDENTLRISYVEDNEDREDEKRIGQEITLNDVVFTFNVTGQLEPDDYNADFSFSYIPAIDVAQSYASRIVADWAEEGAGVINMTIRGVNPKKEMDFINGLIKNYQELDLEGKNETAINTIEFINHQLAGIRDSLNQAERQLQMFKDKNIVTDLNSEALRLYGKIEGLELQKTDLILHDRYYSYLNDYIVKSNNFDQVILPSSVGITDPILVGLISDMMKLQTDMKMLTRSGGFQNPLVTEGTKRMEGLKNDIQESVRNQKSIDKIKLDFLNKGIKEIEGQLSYLPVAERQLVNIKRNYSLLENLYVFLLQKHAEYSISKASNTTDIVVVNPPVANGPISPSPTKNYLLGLSLGLTLPFVFFVVVEIFNTRIQSREDIEKITSIPFIGGVGHKRVISNVEVFTKPKSAISESFRALRSNLHFFLAGKTKAVFLITSSISGEGKTFSSINMASVFALSGKKTLIVGADMRKPKIFNDFGLTNEIGLSNFLAGLSDIDPIIQRTPYDNLDIVSGGPVPPNPSELILSGKMEAFLNTVRDRYDFIFIDSPPLALVTDAFVLSALADHTLFIIRQNYTPKVLLKTIDDYYKNGKIKNLSIVLNDIHKSGPGYGYGYSYGYGYTYEYGYGLSKKNGHGYYEE